MRLKLHPVAPAPTDALVQLLFVTTELARMVPTAKPVPPLETAAPAIALTATVVTVLVITKQPAKPAELILLMEPALAVMSIQVPKILAVNVPACLGLAPLIIAAVLVIPADI